MLALDMISRRRLLTTATAGAAMLSMPARSRAKMPTGQAQAPYFYRFKLGDAECSECGASELRSACRLRRRGGTRSSGVGRYKSTCRWRAADGIPSVRGSANDFLPRKPRQKRRQDALPASGYTGATK